MKAKEFDTLFDIDPDVALWSQAMEFATQKWDRWSRPIPMDISSKRHVHLIAMRCYKGLDRRKMSFRSRVPFAVLEYYETARDAVIPKYVEDVYVKSLKLTKKDLKKIDEILAGERTMEEEKDREIPADIRKAVYKRDRGRCAECRVRSFLHYHHIKHFSKGGMHQVDNLKLLCVACHAKEHRDDKSFHMLKKAAFDLMGVIV